MPLYQRVFGVSPNLRRLRFRHHVPQRTQKQLPVYHLCMIEPLIEPLRPPWQCPTTYPNGHMCCAMCSMYSVCTMSAIYSRCASFFAVPVNSQRAAFSCRRFWSTAILRLIKRFHDIDAVSDSSCSLWGSCAAILLSMI